MDKRNINASGMPFAEGERPPTGPALWNKEALFVNNAKLVAAEVLQLSRIFSSVPGSCSVQRRFRGFRPVYAARPAHTATIIYTIAYYYVRARARGRHDVT